MNDKFAYYIASCILCCMSHALFWSAVGTHRYNCVIHSLVRSALEILLYRVRPPRTTISPPMLLASILHHVCWAPALTLNVSLVFCSSYEFDDKTIYGEWGEDTYDSGTFYLPWCVVLFSPPRILPHIFNYNKCFVSVTSLSARSSCRSVGGSGTVRSISYAPTHAWRSRTYIPTWKA